MKNVIIYADNAASLSELYGAASAVAEKVSAFYAGDKAAACGAETVYYLGDLADGKIVENYIPAMKAVIADVQPELVLMSCSVRCRQIAAQIAASLKTTVMSDSTGLDFANGMASQRMVYGGAAIRTEKSKGITVACLAPGVGEAKELPAVAEVVDVAAAAAAGLKCTGVEVKKVESVDLAAAKKIVCIGRAFTSPEEVALAEEFAKAIGAELGCTRPVAEDDLMAYNRYVGISGAMTRPDVYIGLGISGQIQHLVGVNTAKVMFAVNKDDKAPIFSAVDYGMVGKVADVLPKLTELLK